MVRAVLDVGSNSVLLLVSMWDGERWTVLHETSEVTGLGEGTRSTGLLSEPGMSRTLAAVARAFEIAKGLGAESVNAAATMAARMATNAAVFLERARDQGTPVWVLSGEMEAELGFRAIAEDPLFHGDQRITIIDPGGQSTEFTTADRSGAGWSILFRRSFAIGGLGLREGAMRPESLGPDSLLRASAAIDDAISLRYLPGQCGRAVVLGATGTNLVTMRERMADWDASRVHGQTLECEEVSRWVSVLSAMTDAERAAQIGLERGREKTIHAGALILERCLFALGSERVTVSARGWRHALLESPSPPPTMP